MLCILLLVFFQAEDGIRDLVRSRGLGDVYKRQTPGSVVFRNELVEVIQYAPATPNVHRRPLVIVPPCINKYYILDLTPENSFVRYAVEQGHTVFMASWRNITADQGALTWDDYLQDGVMRAIDVALDIRGADQGDQLGVCIGGGHGRPRGSGGQAVPRQRPPRTARTGRADALLGGRRILPRQAVGD